MPYYYHSPRRKKSRKIFRKIILITSVGISGYFIFSIFFTNKISQPSKAENYNIDLTQIASHQKPELKWPAYGQSAIGADDYGVLDTHNSGSPAPIASVAKVMTAIAVLDKYPLKVNELGPKIKITEKDEEFFNNHLEVGGASVHLVKGTEINEYHTLQLMLMKSYNNTADTLANWAFGSIDEYTKYANQKAKEIGMKNANFADASGLSPNTTATASDLIALGDYALDNPVIAEIVSTWQTDIPGFGEKTNTNQFLDFENNGVIGIKTGDTDEAGGTYLVAAKRIIEGSEITLIASVMGAPNHFAGQKDTMPLVDSMETGFKKIKLVEAGKALGKVPLNETDSFEFGSEKNIEILFWSEQKITPKIELDPKASTNKDYATLGNLIINTGTNNQIFPLVNLSQPEN